MKASALLMAVLGVIASFLPQEILAASGAPPGLAGVLWIQITGALYLGFGALNWMARGNLLGGIYSRPVALGNFIHFAVAGVVLLKAVIAGHLPAAFLASALVYSTFGVWFGIVLFTHPLKDGKGTQ